MSERLPLWRRLRRRWWLAVALGFGAAVSALPRAAGRRLCRALAALAFRLRPRERHLARTNLAAAFPHRPAPWREAVLRGSVDALAENLYAALTLERQAARGFPDVDLRPGTDGRTLPEVLAALRAAGRGPLLLTAHLGCWELLGAWLAARLGGFTVVTATVHNPAVDRLLQDRRRRLGLEPVPRRAGFRPVWRALQAGAVVGLVADQNVRAPGADVPFLGRPAPTPLGPYRLALRLDAPLVPAAAVRERGRWVISHLAPIEPKEADGAEDLALRANLALSSLIRRDPDQWVWFHDRWNLASTCRRP